MTQQIVIKFNIGGNRYEVSQSLLQSYPDSMLTKSAAEQWHTNPNAEIFIDRNGSRFQYVLDYLRDGIVHLPVFVTKASFLIDLQFYAVDVKEDAIVETIDACHFSKYVPLVNDVLNSWEKEKGILDNRKNILEDCITILRAFRLRSHDVNPLLLESLQRCAPSFTDCNEELRKVGLRVKYEEGFWNNRRKNYNVLLALIL